MFFSHLIAGNHMIPKTLRHSAHHDDVHRDENPESPEECAFHQLPIASQLTVLAAVPPATFSVRPVAEIDVRAVEINQSRIAADSVREGYLFAENHAP